jgi:sortase (surface protein transpeptidase)
MSSLQPTTPPNGGPDTAPRRRASRWLYLFPVLLLLAAGLSWRANARPDGDGGNFPGEPSPVLNNSLRDSESDSLTDRAADPLADPKRYHPVENGMVEDSGTGLQLRAVEGKSASEVFAEATQADLNAAAAQAAKGQAASKWAEQARKQQMAFPDDLRYGIGPRPSGIQVESIGVKTWITAIGVDPNRAIRVPHRADIVGWWSGGSVPGEIGPTVLVGHFDSKSRAGVFERLKDVKVSDLVIISQTDGSTYTYFVTEVQQLKKTAFPTERVYGRTKESALRLVTCGGKFDRSTGHYVENTVVYADLLSFVPSPYPTTTYSAPTTSTTSTSTTVVSTLPRSTISGTAVKPAESVPTVPVPTSSGAKTVPSESATTPSVASSAVPGPLTLPPTLPAPSVPPITLPPEPAPTPPIVTVPPEPSAPPEVVP